jgi:hypothetical protein
MRKPLVRHYFGAKCSPRFLVFRIVVVEQQQLTGKTLGADPPGLEANLAIKSRVRSDRGDDWLANLKASADAVRFDKQRAKQRQT